MTKLDEETALSVVFANTKRKKRSADLLTIAKSFEYLVSLYGSKKAVADKVGLSSEMIREFLITLKLPREIQNLISGRKIDSIDIVREISTVKEPSKQVVVAKAFANSLSKDVRDMKRFIRHSDLSVQDAKKAILDAKQKGFHIFVMDFDEDTYQAILKEARIKKIKPVELVRTIIIGWLKQRTK